MKLPDYAAPLLAWYSQNARELPWRSDPTAYRVWISEIMLQQTRVEAVRPYFERFMQWFPTLQALADADQEQVLKAWEGLGYYSRARNLHKTACLLAERGANTLPSDYDALLELPGIGRYTAGAIASIAFGKPAPAVDGNVLRVAARLAACADCVDETKIKTAVEQAVLERIPAGRAGDHTQALMELGATVCTPGVPHCLQCPLQALCQSFRNGNPTDYPVRRAKKSRRVEPRTVLLLLCGNRVAVRKRPDEGLLAGLWEYPNLPGAFSAEELSCWLETQELKPAHLLPLPAASHIFTHIEWQLTGYLVEVEAVNDAFAWVEYRHLAADYAVPSAFSAYTSVLQDVFRP